MTMNKTFLYPYKTGSASAKALADALGIKQIKRENSHFHPTPNKTVINWGCSNLPEHIEEGVGSVINFPHLVQEASNKLAFFKNMEFHQLNDYVVPWTTDVEQVHQWLTDDKTVVARKSLTGHSGEGIEIMEGAEALLVFAPLYTLYKPKKHEYRIHCVRQEDEGPYIFDVQRKARKTDVADDDVNWKVRNLDGGFIYARNDVDLPDCVRDCALKVFTATGLDFGAIDIIYQKSTDKAFALEINTAPGLSGSTLDNYVKMFQELLE